VPTNWQDIPRDPIADDDELEYLYQVAELQKSAPLADPKKYTSSRVPTPKGFKDRKKPSLPVNGDSGIGKLA